MIDRIVRLIARLLPIGWRAGSLRAHLRLGEFGIDRLDGPLYPLKDRLLLRRYALDAGMATPDWLIIGRVTPQTKASRLSIPTAVRTPSGFEAIEADTLPVVEV